jgi:exo-beta-1,3-glucanase (GH17 family)
LLTLHVAWSQSSQWSLQKPSRLAEGLSNLAALPGHFTSARLYASSDCNTLANAVPAAIATGTTLLVGVWTEDTNHFNAEKAALLAAVQEYGHNWIISVSVGSEDLYRGNTDANTLASQIHDVRGMLWSVGAGSVEVGRTSFSYLVSVSCLYSLPITDVDTWTAWVKPENAPVIMACDFVGTDGYPYYQDASINDGSNTFWSSVDATRRAVNNVKPGTWVWITETGWPISGNSLGAAQPSTANAQSYWKSVACQAFKEAHTFWFTLQDYSSSPSFGVVNSAFQPNYDLSC